MKLKPLRSVKPVDVRRRFSSITVYNKAGYMEKHDKGLYSFNNITNKKNADGSITNNFGCEPSAPNNLPITPGWS